MSSHRTPGSEKGAMVTKSAPISVVMAAYNGEAFIGQALDSVRKQTVSVSEVIVIDDGSTDATAEIAKSRGVRVIRQHNQGVSTARNVGIQAATQPWVAFLDQDDLWEPEKVQAQWEAALAVPDAGMVTCDFLQFRGEEILIPSFLGLPDRYHGARKETVSDHLSLIRMVDRSFVEAGFFLFPSAVMARRDVLMTAGLFDPTLPGGSEDVEFFWRILNNTSLLVVERPLMRWRGHSTNVSGNTLQMGLNKIMTARCVTRSPERYPEAVVQFCRRVQPDRMRNAGRMLLHRGEMRRARPLLWQSLIRRPRPRTAAYWLATWLGPGGFSLLHKIFGKGPAEG